MLGVGRTIAGLAGFLLLAGAAGLSAQSADTVARRPAAAQLHAERRAWLEARRQGMLDQEAPPAYGSAVVGGVPAHGLLPTGGIPVICAGILGGPDLRRHGGVSFRGDCRPQFHGFTNPFLPGDQGDRMPWGVEEYGWTGWNWSPLWPFAWSAGPGAGYGFTWPGHAAGECARLQIAPAGAPPIDVQVSLQAFGIAEVADLDLAIEARLARGLAVDLYAMDGRWIRIEPGTLLDDIRIMPCANR